MMDDEKAIEAYLDQTLSDDERELFENRMKEDVELFTEVRVQQEMRAQYSDTPVEHVPEYNEAVVSALTAHLKSREVQELSAKIKAGKQRYGAQNSSKTSWRPYLYYAAAAVTLLLVATVIFFNQESSMQELYVAYNDVSDLPSLTTKGDDQGDLAEGERLFSEEKYAEVISLFDQSAYRQNPQVLEYLGLSYLELDRYDKALATFDELLSSNTLDSNKGYWYKTMTYLKQGNRKKTIENLQIIKEHPTYYKFNSADALLEELEQ